jgi:hypothetical protein
MARRIRLADLSAMSVEDREDALRELTLAATGEKNGTASATAARIRRLEIQYEMSSDDMLARLADKSLKETAEIADWLFLLEVLHAGAAK